METKKLALLNPVSMSTYFFKKQIFQTLQKYVRASIGWLATFKSVNKHAITKALLPYPPWQWIKVTLFLPFFSQSSMDLQIKNRYWIGGHGYPGKSMLTT